MEAYDWMEPAYGEQPDGTYLAPCRYTVYFHREDAIATCIAGCAQNVLPIPLPASVDWDNAPRVPKYLTPTVIIIDEEISVKHIAGFRARGFTNVYLLKRNPSCDEELHILSALDIIDVENQLVAQFLMELFACAETGTTSEIANCSRESCIKFIAGLAFSGSELAEFIVANKNSSRAFDNIEHMMAVGNIAQDYAKRYARERLQHPMPLIARGKRIAVHYVDTYVSTFEEEFAATHDYEYLVHYCVRKQMLHINCYTSSAAEDAAEMLTDLIGKKADGDKTRARAEFHVLNARDVVAFIRELPLESPMSESPEEVAQGDEKPAEFTMSAEFARLRDNITN